MKDLVRNATRRYLLEWAALFLSLMGTALLLPRFGVSPRIAWSIGYGMGIAGLGALPVYWIVAHGLAVDPASFMNRWFASMSVKLAVLVVLAGSVLWLGILDKRALLVALAGAFPVFSLHQVLRLVQLSDRAEKLRAGGPRPPEADVGR